MSEIFSMLTVPKGGSGIQAKNFQVVCAKKWRWVLSMKKKKKKKEKKKNRSWILFTLISKFQKRGSRTNIDMQLSASCSLLLF